MVVKFRSWIMSRISDAEWNSHQARELSCCCLPTRLRAGLKAAWRRMPLSLIRRTATSQPQHFRICLRTTVKCLTNACSGGRPNGFFTCTHFAGPERSQAMAGQNVPKMSRAISSKHSASFFALCCSGPGSTKCRCWRRTSGSFGRTRARNVRQSDWLLPQGAPPIQFTELLPGMSARHSRGYI